MDENINNKPSPLSGIRVLELGTMVAGPVCGTLLADFGAEVIKVEPPGTGDPIRHSGPQVDGESLYWQVEGRNKKSITVNLRKPEGQKVLRDLVEHVDVLIENFKPGTMKKWGLDYEALKKINPRLVMLSVSGFGQTGPYAERPAYDRIALAYSGFLNMTGYPDRPPVRPGTAVADYQGALFGAFGIMLALYYRDAQGGEGQHIDCSLFESIFRFTDIMVMAYDKLGIPRERRGNTHFAAAPGDHYLTNDGRYLCMTVAASNVFRRLCEAMGRPELADDPRFVSHADRSRHFDEINGIVAQWIESNPIEEVCTALEKHSVPHSLIYGVEEIVDDPHYAARGSIKTIEHPKIGKLKIQASQPILSASPAVEITPATSLGHDTENILSSWLNLGAETLRELRETDVI